MLEARMTSADWKLNDVKVEYTSRDSPQQNSLAEVALRTLAGRARAMTVAANLPPEHKKNFTMVAIQHATALDNLIPVEIDGLTKSRYEWQHGEPPKYAANLLLLGTAGAVVLKNRDIQPKLEDCGKKCCYVGVPLNHAADTYRMWHSPNAEYITRDVTFLNRMYFSKPGGVTEVTTQTNNGCPNTAPTMQENVLTEPNNNAANNPTTNPSDDAVRDEPGEEQMAAEEDMVEQPEPDDDRHEEEHQVTRSSQISRPPAWLIEYVTSALDTGTMQEVQHCAATYSPQMA
jgi:hypothetical protein